MSGPPSEPADVPSTTEQTRRRLLRLAGAGAVGAGTAGALGLASPAAAQADDLDWEATLGDDVESWSVETESIDPGELARPSASFESGTVVIEGTRRFSVTGCDTVRPRRIEYDAGRDQLGVSTVDVHLPDHTDQEVCAGAESTVRYELTVELADDVEPASARVAEYDLGEATVPPTVTTCYPTAERPPLPDAVADYELDVEAISRSAFEDEPPAVTVEEAAVVVEGQTRVGESPCHSLRLDRVATADGVLEIDVQSGFDPGGGSPGECGDLSQAVRYELSLSLDGERPAAVDALVGGYVATRRTVVGDAGVHGVDADVATGFEFGAARGKGAQSDAQPSVSVVDDSLVVEGTVRVCRDVRATLGVDAVEPAEDEAALVAAVGSDAEAAPGAALEHEGCSVAHAVPYEFAVDLADQPPETVEVRERGVDGVESTALTVRTPTPADLSVVAATPDAVSLDWAAVDSASSYRVAVDGESGSTTSSPWTRVPDVLPLLTREFAVTARSDGRPDSQPATVEVEIPPGYEEYPVTVSVDPATAGPDGASAVTVSVTDLPAGETVEAAAVDLSVPNDAAIADLQPPHWSDADPDPGDLVATLAEVGDGAGAATVEVAAWGDEDATAEDGTLELLTAVFEDDGVAPADVDADLPPLGGVAGTGRIPPALGDHLPQPRPSDGLVYDFDDDGDLTTADVGLFQEHLFTDAIQEYPRYYDYTGNGYVSHADVIEHFVDVASL